MQLPNRPYSVEELICNESFQQYCLGTSPEEQILWEKWLVQHPECQQDFMEAKKMFNLLSLNQGSRIQQLKDLRSGIKQREVLQQALSFDEQLVETSTPSLSAAKISKLYLYLGAAVAAVFLVLSPYFFNPKVFTPSKDTDLATGEIMQVISSGPAPRKTLVLTDGTLITLGKGSSIELHKRFNSHEREVWLKGEAFFDVKHDASRPFTVYTAFDDIKVLGTTFNVKAYPEAKTMVTSLIKGSVQVNSRQFAGYSVILSPNQKLISSKVADPVVDRNPKAHYTLLPMLAEGKNPSPPELKWLKSRLDIDNQPLSVIAGKLQNWYGIEIVITDESVKKYRYSGIFENETILKTLEALQLSYPFTFKLEQDRILISK